MATTTINTTAAEDSRLVVAFGTFLNLGRNATQAEIKAALVAWLTSVVNEQEYQAAKKAIAITNIAPT
jgi:hypothetical protein